MAEETTNPDETSKPPEVKAVIGFGTKEAIAGSTPLAIKYLYRTLMFFGGLWALVIEPQFPNIPVNITHNIDKWIVVGNGVVYYISQFFGWVVPKRASEQTTEV